jgi:hypothetical protein
VASDGIASAVRESLKDHFKPDEEEEEATDDDEHLSSEQTNALASNCVAMSGLKIFSTSRRITNKSQPTAFTVQKLIQLYLNKYRGRDKFRVCIFALTMYMA